MRIRSNETQPYEKQVLPSEEIPIVKSLSEERSREIPQVPANPIWNALGKSADIVYDVAMNMLEVERQENYQAAQVEMSRQLTQARLDIINDPRYLQSTAGELTGAWRTKSDAIRDNVIGQVKHKQSKADLLKSWQATDNDSMVYFTGHGWQNTLARSKDQRAKASVQATMDVVNSGTKPSEEPFLRMKKMYDDAVAARTMTREDADAELQMWMNNTTREYFQRQIVTQVLTNPNFDNNSKSLTKVIEDEKVLSANDKTILLEQVERARHTAEVRSKQDSEIEEEKVAYAKVFSRFGGDNKAAAAYLRNPKNEPDLKLGVRNRLAATFEHMDYVKEQQLKDEQDKVMNDFLPRIYGSERTLTAEDVYNNKVLSPQQKEHFLRLLQQPVNKKDFTTNWNNYNARLSEAYKGEIKNRDDIFGAGDLYDGIGVKDREHIWQVSRAAEREDVKMIGMAYKYGSKIIEETTLVPSMGDPQKSVAKRKADYENDLKNTIDKEIKAGKKLENLLDPASPDYVVDGVLSRHLTSREEQFKNINRKSKELITTPNKDRVVITPTAPEKKPVVPEISIEDASKKIKLKNDLIQRGYSEDEVINAMDALGRAKQPVNERNIIYLMDQKRNAGKK